MLTYKTFLSGIDINETINNKKLIKRLIGKIMEKIIKDLFRRMIQISWKMFTLHKKLSFPLRISSVNETKFARNCGFRRIY